MNSKVNFFFPLFLILYEFCVNMSNDMYLPALPMISTELATSINWVQLTITIWLAGNTSVQIIIGPLSDRFGRRPILFGGGALFLLSTLGCALSPSISFLITFRFLQGIGVCSMMVAGYASIHDLYEDKRAIYILALMGSAAVIAPAIGPVFGGFVLSLGGWRTIFYLLFFIAFFALASLWFMMPESISPKRIKFNHVLRSYRNILSNISFMTSATSFGLLYGGIIGWITASPFLLIQTLKLTPIQFGWLQIPVFGSYIVGAQLVKPLLEKIGKTKLIFFGLMISTISGALLILFSILYENKTLSFILPMVGYTLGFGFASAPLNRTTLTATQEQKGSAIAIFYLTMTGSGTLISLILSVFDENSLSISIVIAASVFLSCILNFIRHKYNQLKS